MGDSGAQSRAEERYNLLLPVPAEVQSTSLSLIGHATDRLSHERGDLVLGTLLQQPLRVDEQAPQARIVSPVAGSVAVPCSSWTSRPPSATTASA